MFIKLINMTQVLFCWSAIVMKISDRKWRGEAEAHAAHKTGMGGEGSKPKEGRERARKGEEGLDRFSCLLALTGDSFTFLSNSPLPHFLGGESPPDILP